MLWPFVFFCDFEFSVVEGFGSYMVVWYSTMTLLGVIPLLSMVFEELLLVVLEKNVTGYPYEQPRRFPPFGLVRVGSDMFVRYH